MAFVTFIIPSLGRPSLISSLSSLRAQTDSDWSALICFDRVQPTIQPDEKIQVLRYLPNHPTEWRQGAVRNFAIEHATSPWIGLLDDDDTVTPDYVATLKQNADAQVVIFQMRYQSGKVLPPNERRIRRGHVGISFAFQREVFQKIKFTYRKCEDYYFLDDARKLRYKIKFVPTVTYRVKH
ncbi:MAG: glycosyltransferase [Candidatus Nanopelagicaceae bacterium]|nr:glycosyltransferase [Candidatus Nanopelagicaceae bacterium]